MILIKNLKSLKDILKINTKPGLLVPAIQNWTLKHGNIDPDSASVGKILQFVRKAEKLTRDRKHFHPSSSYACMRRQLLDVYGYPPTHEINIKLDHIFDDGKWRHLRWQTIFFRMGILYDAEIDIQHKAWYMVGNADAIVRLRRKLVLVELKGANTAVYSRCVASGKPLEGHLWQCLCYMVALRIMGVPIDSGVIFYENKNDQEIWEYVVKYEEHAVTIAAIEKRYLTLRTFKKKRQLSGFECTLVDTDTKFRQCPQAINCLKLMHRGEYPHDEANERIRQNRKERIKKRETPITNSAPTKYVRRGNNG